MNQRVFAVEDDRFMRDAVDLILTQAGYDFSGVASGEEAFDAIRRWMPDLVLLDIGLPGIGGLSVLSGLRRRGISTPILMLTADASPITVREVIEMGGNGYVVKPFEPRDLVERVRSALTARPVGSGIRAVHHG
jgi:two-component system, OmpR family, response regulator MtrA